MTDFVTLKADIASWSTRDDTTAQIPTFVRLCEADIRRDVRVRAMEVADDAFTVDSRTETLPSGFISLRRIVMDGTDRKLDYLTPERLRESNLWSLTGTPSAYTIEGDNLVFAPEPTTGLTAELLYFKAFDALSADSDTNWVLTNAYDVYLFCSLAYAKAFEEDDEQALKWRTLYEKAVKALNKSEHRARFSGSSKIRTGYPVV